MKHMATALILLLGLAGALAEGADRDFSPRKPPRRLPRRTGRKRRPFSSSLSRSNQPVGIFSKSSSTPKSPSSIMMRRLHPATKPLRMGTRELKEWRRRTPRRPRLRSPPC